MQYLLIQSLNSFSHGKKKVVYNSKEILKTDTFYVQSMYNRFKVALPFAFKIYLLYKISNTVLNLQTHLQVLLRVCSMYALYAYLSSMNHLAYFSLHRVWTVFHITINYFTQFGNKHYTLDALNICLITKLETM